MAFVTFIIPSLGRETLYRTVDSLLAQTDPDWDVVIFFDGVEGWQFDDQRIYTIRGGPTHNCGLARNKAIEYASGEWLAFVDDDDYILPEYVAKLRGYTPKHDVVQFTFRILQTGVLRPTPGVNKITAGETGVSFSVRSDFRQQHNLWFRAGYLDDYNFLKDCEAAGGRIIITHDIQYYVPRVSEQGITNVVK